MWVRPPPLGHRGTSSKKQTKKHIKVPSFKKRLGILPPQGVDFGEAIDWSDFKEKSGANTLHSHPEKQSSARKKKKHESAFATVQAQNNGHQPANGEYKSKRSDFEFGTRKEKKRGKWCLRFCDLPPPPRPLRIPSQTPVHDLHLGDEAVLHMALESLEPPLEHAVAREDTRILLKQEKETPKDKKGKNRGIANWWGRGIKTAMLMPKNGMNFIQNMRTN